MPIPQKFLNAIQDVKSEEHAALLKEGKRLINISRSEMSKNYTKWDQNDAVFRSRRASDKEDRSAVDKGQPQKMIVGLTQAQVMTFVAFCVMGVTQNQRFFELEPVGSEDNPLREPMELILERDTRKNHWSTFLVQFFLDIGKFAIGAAEICYKEDYRYIRLPQTETTADAFGGQSEKTTDSWVKIPTFCGNRVVNISPYRFYPDTRVPLPRYQEGEFCGSEDFWSLSSLQSDASGLFNLDVIPKMDNKQIETRKKITRGDWSGFELRENPQVSTNDPAAADVNAYVKSGSVAVTKIVLDMIPAEFTVQGKKAVLGPEKFPVRYILWYGNDATILKFEEATYLHHQFPYILGEFLPDQHQTINEGLADNCDQVTSLITWLINAHVTSVRSTIDSKFIVDPAGIDIKSLESRSPYIFLRKNASQTGIDRYIKQFQVTDVTQMFMDDAGKLKTLLEAITGFSEMMQGQSSAGRRSATQDRVVAQSGSARGKCTLMGIWDLAFEPLGKQLLINNRQEMDFDTFSRIVGKVPTDKINPDTQMAWTSEELYALFHADPLTLATDEQFFTFDGTLPSEKSYLAQSLQEILMQMLQNPQIAAVMGYGPAQFRQLFDDIYNLRGVTPGMLPPSNPLPAPPQMGTQIPGQPPTPPESNVLPMQPATPASASV